MVGCIYAPWGEGARRLQQTLVHFRADAWALRRHGSVRTSALKTLIEFMVVRLKCLLLDRSIMLKHCAHPSLGLKVHCLGFKTYRVALKSPVMFLQFSFVISEKEKCKSQFLFLQRFLLLFSV